jgi:hypothetical protein
MSKAEIPLVSKITQDIPKKGMSLTAVLYSQFSSVNLLFHGRKTLILL